MAPSRDNQPFVESGISFSDHKMVALGAGLHRPELTPWPLLLRAAFRCLLKRNVYPPPQLHVHNYIRFSQLACWVRVASIPMPPVDRPWGRIPSLPAGFSGGGIFYTSATPQHGIAPTRDCRFYRRHEEVGAPCTADNKDRSAGPFPATAFRDRIIAGATGKYGQ